MSRTLFDRLWDDHLIADLDAGTGLLQVDRHVVHEVSSPEAFRQLKASGRSVASPQQTFATQDHILSTRPGRDDTSFPEGTEFVRFLRRNCVEHGIRLFDVGDPRQGIVHVVAAELGLALPGCTLVCGDSHTATLGAFGALAWGVGTSEVAHVLATQTLSQLKPRPLQIRVEGRLPDRVVPKDIILAILRRFGVTAGVGHAIEYAGSTIAALPMEGRMTICNMSIELGARFGFIAPDDTTFEYLSGRPYAPQGGEWDRAVEHWRTLRSDDDAQFAKLLELDVDALKPQITWGTTPGDVIDIDQPVPALDSLPDSRRAAATAALAYMGLAPGVPLEGLPVDVVFIGSCTNSRLSDLRSAASLVRGRKVARGIRALVVPGSTAVRRAAEDEGLDEIFRDAGFEWREAGCSMCLAINDDVVRAGCALRLDVQPEFRRPPGTGRAHASGQSVDRRCGRDRRARGRSSQARLGDGMEPLLRLSSVVAPLLRDNIDTDAIIPAAYMRSLSTDPGSGLFARWRYRPDGSPEPGFVLNDPRFSAARILIAGANFGCGSSRENAVWALDRFGIRCVVALGFSDIFRENAFKNGLLPIALRAPEHRRLAFEATKGELRVTVDVAQRHIELPSSETISFDLDARRQARLLSGSDEIGDTLQAHERIATFRQAHRQRAPWLYTL